MKSNVHASSSRPSPRFIAMPGKPIDCPASSTNDGAMTFMTPSSSRNAITSPHRLHPIQTFVTTMSILVRLLREVAILRAIHALLLVQERQLPIFPRDRRGRDADVASHRARQVSLIVEASVVLSIADRGAVREQCGCVPRT